VAAGTHTTSNWRWPARPRVSCLNNDGTERAGYLRAIAAEVEMRRERLAMLQSLNTASASGSAHGC